MAGFRRELPGDILQEILAEYGIPTVAEFARQHEKRVGQALEARADELSEDEMDRMWRRLAPEHNDKWYNRFAIAWKPDMNPKRWRALCTLEHRDALVLAGWFAEGDETDVRLQRAIQLQDSLRLGLTYDEITELYKFDEDLELAEVYDTLCWVFVDTVRDGDLFKAFSFDDISSLASRFSRNALQALARLGVVDLPEGGLTELPGWDQRRGTPHPQTEAAPESLAAIYDWASLLLDGYVASLERRN